MAQVIVDCHNSSIRDTEKKTQGVQKSWSLPRWKARRQSFPPPEVAVVKARLYYGSESLSDQTSVFDRFSCQKLKARSFRITICDFLILNFEVQCFDFEFDCFFENIFRVELWSLHISYDIISVQMVFGTFQLITYKNISINQYKSKILY